MSGPLGGFFLTHTVQSPDKTVHTANSFLTDGDWL